MGIRDEELKRLVAYATGLGVKVSFKQKKRRFTNCAEWYVDGSQINIYTWIGQSKTTLVLNLIHELAHHRHWIDNNRHPDTELVAALTLEDDRLPKNSIAKKYRKVIYQDEVKATEYWGLIVKDTDIKINPAKIELAKRLDIFCYEYYLKHGNFPVQRVVNQKKKELKNEIK